ncbi:hypothetical protein N7540_013150 [Penicillium herquei]|nr:hypothetical protein N7540_013150 [Penicillium herquei]
MDAPQDRPVTAANSPEALPGLTWNSQLSSKRRFVQALEVLIKILQALDDFRSEFSAINNWIAEIEVLEDEIIPAEPLPPCQVNESLERLNLILIT